MSLVIIEDGKIVEAIQAPLVSDHAALTATHGGVLQTAAMKNVANGIAGLDANNRIATSNMPAMLRSGMLGVVSQSGITIVQGSFGAINNANQTDWNDLLLSQPGYYTNEAAQANLDEFKLSNVVLDAGTYEIVVVSIKAGGGAIIEVLHGATSIGTIDTYNVGVIYNSVATLTYSPIIRTSADLRFRINGRNPSGVNWTLRISRIQIRKTA